MLINSLPTEVLLQEPFIGRKHGEGPSLSASGKEGGGAVNPSHQFLSGNNHSDSTPIHVFDHLLSNPPSTHACIFMTAR